MNQEGINPYLEGVYLTLHCDETNTTENTDQVYWSLNSTNASAPDSDAATTDGLILNVFCDKYQNTIGGLGFTALYTSIILVIASYIHNYYEASVPELIYTQNPKPDNIIKICEAIGTLRLRKEFREEYLMYY